MKVISRGTTNWKKEVTCLGCASVLEIGLEDIDYIISDKEAMAQQYDLEPEGSYFVKCIECNSTILIKSKVLPQSFRDKLRYE